MVTGTSGNPRLKIFMVGLLALTAAQAAQASGPETAAPNATVLLQMEVQADAAKPREQCYLYTQLVTALMESASQQVAAGEDEDAGKTVGRIAEVTAKLQRAAARDAKKLKDAEKLLGESRRRLMELSRIANGAERDAMRSTLLKLDAAHNKILDMVFLQP